MPSNSFIILRAHEIDNLLFAARSWLSLIKLFPPPSSKKKQRQWHQLFSVSSLHGLRTPNEALFHRNPKLLGLVRQCGQINFGAFGLFSADLSATILVLWVPCPCFPLINHYFYKKLSLYTRIPNIYLGLRFEFGLQRIWDLAIECP